MLSIIRRSALVPVPHLDCGHAWLQQPQFVVLEPLDFNPEALTIRDDKSKVASLRKVDPRVVAPLQEGPMAAVDEQRT